MSKIIIVEDDAFLQSLEVSKLMKSSHEILTASNGKEALKKIKEPKIDIILLDLILPDVDGFDILKEIRANESTKTTPVIVFSNLSEYEDIQKAKELGATDFMVKSNFTLDELVDRVNKFLPK